MKKFIAILLSLIMIISVSAVPALAKEEKVVANLSKLSTITKIGLPASDLYTKTGNYTMKLSGENVFKNIKIPCIKDFTGYNALETWVYSPSEVSSSVSIAIISDNKKTASLDYYVATLFITSSGWNKYLKN